MLVMLVFLFTAASTPATQPSIAQELEAYYSFQRSNVPANWDPKHLQQQLDKLNQKPPEAPSWEVAMKQLDSPVAAQRGAAVEHLVAVMDQCLKDEQSGKAPWRATPFWGESAENPARKLRESILDAADHAHAVTEFIPLIRCVLRNEDQLKLQETAVGILAKVDGKEADACRRELVSEPHPNAFVVGAALDQLCQRKAPLPADQLNALCQSHRQVIRQSARRLSAALGRPDPGPFDATAAFRSPAVRKTLDQLEALMIDLPAKDTPFVKITLRYMSKGQVKQTDDAYGWLLQNKVNSVRIYTPQGTFRTYADNAPAEIWQQEQTDDGVQNRKIETTTSITVTNNAIEEYAQQVIRARAKGNEDYELSSRGGLTGQFEGRGASLPEMILSAWLDRAGKADLAASIFLPALDTLYRDQDIINSARNKLGDLLGYRMLVAFDGDRDYPRALELARSFVQHYPNTRFYRYAVGLCDQLPRRMDDFKAFALPTPQRWAAMKPKLTRQQQIGFLCQRLRLLNCFQMGQPGGYYPTETQYAEPCGLSDNAAWGLGKGKTEVINPLLELDGDRYGFVPDGKQPNKGLDLTAEDIPVLVPFLREDWYEPTVSFWRDFVADRSLADTRSDVAEIINAVAHRDICEAQKLASMSEADRENQIKHILAWAEANKQKSNQQLIRERVQEQVDAKAEWREVQGDIDTLVKDKSPRASDFIDHYLANPGDDASSIPEMLEQMQALDKKRAVAWARKFLNHEDPRVRLDSALMVLDSGDK